MAEFDQESGDQAETQDTMDTPDEDSQQVGFAHCLRANEPRDTVCRNCDESFQSRNKPHSHLRAGCKTKKRKIKDTFSSVWARHVEQLQSIACRHRIVPRPSNCSF